MIRRLLVPLLIALPLTVSAQANPAQPSEPVPPAVSQHPPQDVPDKTAPAEQMDCSKMKSKDTSSIPREERKRMIENCEKADRNATPRSDQKPDRNR